MRSYLCWFCFLDGIGGWPIRRVRTVKAPMPDSMLAAPPLVQSARARCRTGSVRIRSPRPFHTTGKHYGCTMEGSNLRPSPREGVALPLRQSCVVGPQGANPDLGGKSPAVSH